MVETTTVTPERLKEIIDHLLKITSNIDLIAYRTTLKPEELKALDDYLKTLPKTEKPASPKTTEATLEDYKKWSTGRTGLTKDELIQNYADTHNMTTIEADRLRNQISIEETKEAAAAEAAKPTAPPPTKPTVPPELIITRTKYPKWWNDEGVSKISLTSPGSQLVITARGDYSLYIAAIVLTVSGECDITFTFGSAGASGQMDLGGSDEPRGMVIAMGNSPAPCGSGTFMITSESDDTVHIGGFVSYFLWKKET